MLAFPAVADKSFLIHIGDRTVGGLERARPARRSVAGARQRRGSHCRIRVRGVHAARRSRWASARRSRFTTGRPRRGSRWREAITEHRGRRRRGARRHSAVRELDGGGRPRRTTTTRCTRWSAPSARSCARRSGWRCPSARTRYLCARCGDDGGKQRAVTAPVSLIVSAFAPVARHSPHAYARAYARARLGARADRSRERRAAARRLVPGAGVRPVRGCAARSRRSAAADQVVRRTTRAARGGARYSRITTAPTVALFATLAEMAFAAHVGLDVELGAAVASDAVGYLFAEELGAVMQVRDADLPARRARARGALARARGRRAASLRTTTWSIRRAGAELYRASRDRAAAQVVGAHVPHAGAARRSGLRARGVRERARCRRSRPQRRAHVRAAERASAARRARAGRKSPCCASRA